MNKLFKYSLLLLFVVTAFSCQRKDNFGIFARNNYPAVAVTFPNASMFGAFPFIVISRAPALTQPFQIQLQIPANSGRTIANVEIKGGGTAINAGTLTTGSVPFLVPAAAITGYGSNVVTITTSLAEFNTRYPGTSIAAPAVPYDILNTASFTEIAFMFRVTLDNGDQVIPVQFRGRVTQ
jgi:hypothetical protein